MSIITDALKKAELEKQKKLNTVKAADTFMPSDKEEISRSFRDVPRSSKSVSTSFIKPDSRAKFWIIVGVIGIAVIGGFVLLGELLGRQRSVIIIPNVDSKSGVTARQGGIEFSLNVNPESVSFSKEVPVAAQKKELKPAAPAAESQTSPSKPGFDILGLGEPKFTLYGIAYDPVKPSAIINNEVVEVGQTISGAKVVQIAELDVTLEQNGRKFKLTM